MKRTCNKCHWIREYKKGRHYGSGEWMCEECYQKLIKSVER